MLEPIITHKCLKQAQTECECGNLLPYRTSPFMTAEKRVCPKCKRIHNVDYALTDWGTNFKGGERMNKAQWKALYKFADEYGFDGGSEILNLLKVRGVIANNDLFDDLPRYAGTTYDDMYRFLADNLL